MPWRLRIELTGAVVGSASLGSVLAFWLASEPFGYLAGFRFIEIIFLGGGAVLFLLVTGMLLVLISKKRWYGMLSFMSASLLVASYVTTFKVLQKAGKVSYEHEQMVSIGPDVTHGLVIYFKHGVSNDQVNYFWDNV